MPAPQSGILPEASSHALFITTVLKDDGDQATQLRHACARVPQLTAEIAAIDADAGLVSVVAIGSDAWDRLFAAPRPRQLRPFRARSEQGREAPATAGDLFFHIRSERPDLNYLTLRKIFDCFADGISVVEEVNGFRYLDSRDLTGFVDGTENPQGEERGQVDCRWNPGRRRRFTNLESKQWHVTSRVRLGQVNQFMRRGASPC